jgi:hypothetical protein
MLYTAVQFFVALRLFLNATVLYFHTILLSVCPPKLFASAKILAGRVRIPTYSIVFDVCWGRKDRSMCFTHTHLI